MERQVSRKIELGETFASNIVDKGNVLEIRQEIGERMTKKGAHIRSAITAAEGAEEARIKLNSLKDNAKLTNIHELTLAFQNYDMLITQYVYLSAIEDFINKGGRSRGSYLVNDPAGELPLEGLKEEFRFSISDGSLTDKVQKVTYKEGLCNFKWDSVKKIPEEDSWFENVWNKYMKDKIVE